jgi:hypothetical protein
LEDVSIDQASIFHEQPALYCDNPHLFLGVQDWAEYAMNVADQQAGEAVTISNTLHTALDKHGIRRYEVKQD